MTKRAWLCCILIAAAVDAAYWAAVVALFALNGRFGR